MVLVLGSDCVVSVVWNWLLVDVVVWLCCFIVTFIWYGWYVVLFVWFGDCCCFVSLLCTLFIVVFLFDLDC